jgi:hypothetical protein
MRFKRPGFCKHKETKCEECKIGVVSAIACPVGSGYYPLLCTVDPYMPIDVKKFVEKFKGSGDFFVHKIDRVMYIHYQANCYLVVGDKKKALGTLQMAKMCELTEMRDKAMATIDEITVSLRDLDDDSFIEKDVEHHSVKNKKDDGTLKVYLN